MESGGHAQTVKEPTPTLETAQNQGSVPIQKRKPNRKPRLDAIVIKEALEKTVAEVFEQIRCKFSATDSGASVKAIRKRDQVKSS